MKNVALVTGLPRSGTTAVGSYLGLIKGCATLHEPMNGQTGLSSVRHHFEVPGAEGFSSDSFIEIYNGVAGLNLAYKRKSYARDSFARQLVASAIGSRPRLSYLIAKYLSKCETIIWKDPFALFCLEPYLRTGSKAVVLARNPLATAASVKRMQWASGYKDVAHRLSQANLWKEKQFPKSRDQEGFDPVTNSALLWAVAYDYVLRIAEDFENISLISMDRFVENPAYHISRICEFLGLPFEERVESKILGDYSVGKRESGDVPEVKRAHDPSRDYTKVNSYWSKVLTEEECALVSSITSSVERKYAEYCI